MSQKVVIVTGTSSGIGLATAVGVKLADLDGSAGRTLTTSWLT